MTTKTTRSSQERSRVVIRPLVDNDLDTADRIFRTAFGTFLGAPEPERFFGDMDLVRTRWRADPAAVFGAEMEGNLVGSNFVTSWGSVGFFGPLTVRPDYWDRGIARLLLEPTMDLFASWKTRHMGLFTFAQSPKHVGLYQRFGFWPRYLTALMTAPVATPDQTISYERYSNLASDDRTGVSDAIRELTAEVFEGLDIGREIDAVLGQELGETVLIDDASGLLGVAVCHMGPGTEAGSGICYVKFAAVRPGYNAERSFERLIDACQEVACASDTKILSAGVNLGREKAYAVLRRKGFRSQMQGVTMHRPNEPGYDRSNCYVLDDWR
jgi:GNAT superfamily N-acetyltransferase